MLELGGNTGQSDKCCEISMYHGLTEMCM